MNGFVVNRLFMLCGDVGRVLRAILGVPDYERYVEHCRVHHPGTAPLTPEEFSLELLERRYSRPGSRCC